MRDQAGTASPALSRQASPQPPRHVLFLLLEVVSLAVVLGMATLFKTRPGPLSGDAGIETAIQEAILPHPPVANAMEAVSTGAWPVPSAITLGVVIVLFLILRRWLDALVVLGCALIADETTYFLSQYVRRPRPSGHDIRILSVIKGTYSFPSGHVVHGAAVFGLLLFLSWQIRRPLPSILVWLVRVVLIVFIVAMGPSRILEGEHWPSDVLGGLIWGLFWLAISSHVYMWVRHRFPKMLAVDER
ncbi:MAG: phosphatase PAP2 family protein [Chloroflexota bacterium]